MEFIALLPCDADEMAGSNAQITMTAALATARFKLSAFIIPHSLFYYYSFTLAIIAGIEKFGEFCLLNVTVGQKNRGEHCLRIDFAAFLFILFMTHAQK